jgi:ABC-type transporter Mla subunit MlaD
MNLKIAILILILLAQAWPIAGMDALYLGSGLRDQVINLDAGARLPGQSYNFAATGFVAPRIPQTMALSPNIMITQAKKLMDEAKAARDESVSARDEAEAIYNGTQALLAEINQKEQNIQLLQKKAEADAKATAASAAQAGVFLNKTKDIYNKTQALSIEIEDNLSQIKMTLQEARDYANASANASAIDASDINASDINSKAIDTIRASSNVSR